MTRLGLITLHYLFLFSINSFAQSIENLDSLLILESTMSESEEKAKILAKLFNSVLYSDASKAKQYAKEEIEVSKKIRFKEGIALGSYHLGVYYNNVGNIDSALYYYNQSKELFEEQENIDKIITVNHGLAILEYSQGNYKEAISILKSNIGIHLEKEYDSIKNEKRNLDLALSYDLMGQIELFRGNHNLALQETMKALKILETVDKPIRKADALNHLGSVEFYLHNFESSISYNKEALNIYEKYNDKYYQAQVLNDIGNTLYYLKKYDEAIQFLDQSLALAEEMNSGDLIGTAMNNLGKVNGKLGNFDRSIYYSKEALKIFEQSNSQNKIIESLNDLGMSYNAMGKPKVAINYFDRSIALAKEINAKENLKIGLFNRSRSYELLLNHLAALKDFKSYKSVDDSIFSDVKSRQIEELRTIYETEQKEKEIELQRSEISLLYEREKVNALQLLILIAGIILIVIVFALIYYSMKQRMKRNRAERMQLDAELEYKKKELITHALHLANKNEVLEELKNQVSDLKNVDSETRKYTKIINTINFNLHDDNNWENFSLYFEEVHKDFNGQVKQKYPDVTSNELRLMALLKMNLSSKEIANILNISTEGIKKARYRLRKKLSISTDDSLQDLIISL